MTAHVALLALLTAGAGERLLDGDLVLAALDIAAVCDEAGPPPTGDDCAHILVTLWALETGTPSGPLFARPAGGSGCGPLQVQALEGWTPPCEVMRWGGEMHGFEAGLRIFRAKLRRAREHPGAAMALYNGHPDHRESYGRRGARLLSRLRR